MFCSDSKRCTIKAFAVILAGGRGERFWPASQPHFPKQFLTLFDNRPLITQTIQRIAGAFGKNKRLLIIPKELKELTIKYVGKENIVLEPARRNTAPAICLAAMILRKRYGNGIMHVMPADHLIKPKRAFISALDYGARLAAKGYLVTYGIKPSRPETGYGYVKIGPVIGRCRKNVAYRGAGFTEKPNASIAHRYIRSRHYLWNSGIFSFSIEAILAEMECLVPGVYHGVSRYLALRKDNRFKRLPDLSIDYAVMEKSRRLCVVQGDFNWDDVGSWLALERYFVKDRKGNVIIGDARGVLVEDSILCSQDVPLRVFGVKGLIIVVSQHGVLVCKKEHAQELKKLLR